MLDRFFGEKLKIKGAKKIVRAEKNVGIIIGAANCVYSAPREIENDDPMNLILKAVHEFFYAKQPFFHS